MTNAIKYVLLVLMALSSMVVSGQDITWTGGGPSNSWLDSLNWDPARVPVPSDVVEVGNLNTSTFTISNFTIAGLVLRARGKLIIDHPDARLNITNSPAEGIKFILRGELEVNQGTISISNPAGDGIFVDDLSSLINRGTININNFDEDGIHIDRNSSVENYGLINIDQLNGITPNNGINAEDGEFINYSTGQLFVSTCLSLAIPMLTVADGFLFEDLGEALYFSRNCN